MASAIKLKNDIKKLKAAIASKKTPLKVLPTLKKQLEKAENELAASQKAKRAPKASVVAQTSKTLKELIKEKKYRVYQGAGVDLERDAGRPALKTGKRISKNGNVYYEYRPNRIDVRPSRYPKLEKGGSLEDLDKNKAAYEEGGMVNHGFNTGDRVIEIYKGHGIIEDKRGSIVVLNPESGTRFLINLDDTGGERTSLGLSKDEQIAAAKSHIDQSKPIKLGFMDGDGMKQFAVGGEVHKYEGKHAIGVFDEKEFKGMVEESVDLLYQGLGQLEKALNYLRIKGQNGMVMPFRQKFGVAQIEHYLQEMDAYTTKK